MKYEVWSMNSLCRVHLWSSELAPPGLPVPWRRASLDHKHETLSLTAQTCMSLFRTLLLVLMPWQARKTYSSCASTRACEEEGGGEKKLHQQPQKKKGGRKRQCPALCEVCLICLRPSAISADVTHAVGVADLAPATEHAEASLFTPFAVVAALLAPEARLFAPFGQLNLFVRLWVWVDFGEVLFVHACSWLVQRDPGMSQIHWLILVVLSPPSLEPLTLPFYCSPVQCQCWRIGSTRGPAEVMILSRARDALQTPADTRFQRKGQGRGLKNTHKSHFAFPRLPEVVKIKGMHGTPDRTAWTSPSHGEKKRKVLLPEQAWRPQTITAELDSSLPRHRTRLERPWTTVRPGQPKPCDTSTRAVVRRALVAESGKKGRVRGSEADLAQCGALALPPPFLFLWLLVQFFFQRPLEEVKTSAVLRSRFLPLYVTVARAASPLCSRDPFTGQATSSSKKLFRLFL